MFDWRLVRQSMLVLVLLDGHLLAQTIVGKVVMADGSEPSERVEVFMRCSGAVQRLLGRTSSDGSFSFGGLGSSVQIDATSNRAVYGSGSRRPGGARAPADCSVYAFLAGYQSSEVSLAGKLFDGPDIGTIVLSPLGQDLDPAKSSTTVQASEKALKSYEKAEAELARGGKPDKAIKELKKAVKAYPGFAAAWNVMGEAYLLDEDTEKAKEAFRKAIDSDAHFAPPHLALAFLELRDKNYEETVTLCNHALELDSESAEAHFYRGNAFAALGDLKNAELSLRAVVFFSETERFPRTHFLLGTILARTGNIEEAARELQHYLELEPDSRPAEMARQQLERWEAEGVID